MIKNACLTGLKKQDSFFPDAPGPAPIFGESLYEKWRIAQRTQLVEHLFNFFFYSFRKIFFVLNKEDGPGMDQLGNDTQVRSDYMASTN